MASDPSSSYSRIFALLIGINEYPASPELGNLKGAIRDVEKWRDLLLYYQVPTSQIRMLTNEHAHRAGILDALKSFTEDARMRKGDAIFVFYAGHGAEFNPPEGWECGRRKIQSIVPSDFCEIPGFEVPSIPDRTLGALFEDIAEVWGNNITVVLDCCFASSGTRKSGGRARSVPLTTAIHTNDLDRQIWEKTSASPRTSSLFGLKGLRSHILIAACRSGELAWENATSGQFSKALLKLLRKDPPHTLRYSDILNRMDYIADQHPQIEGTDLDRFLFDAHLPSSPSPKYFLHHDDGTDSWFINAGNAQGISPGAQFTAEYGEGHSYVITVGEDIRAFSSAVRFGDQIPGTESLKSPFPVIQKMEGKHEPLAIYVRPDTAYEKSRERLSNLLRDPECFLHNVIEVNEPANAHADFTMEGGKPCIRVLWQMRQQYGLPPSRLFLPDAGDSCIAATLAALSKSIRELERPRGSSTLIDAIHLSAYKLCEVKSPFCDVKRTEMRPIDNSDLLVDKKIDIVAKDETFLGFKLENKSGADIYVTLLHFDETDITRMTTCYRSPFSGPYLPEVPLLAGKSLTLGYGSGGMPPMSFSLRDDDNLAVGFLKLIISTHPLEGTSLLAPSSSSDDGWASVVIPVVLRRYSLATPRLRSPDVWPQTGVSRTRNRTTSMPCRPGSTRGQY